MKKPAPTHYREFLQDACLRIKPSYLVSITLARLYSDAEALRTFSFFCKLVQAKVRCSESVKGIAFIERTWKNARFESQIHMHCVLRTDDSSRDGQLDSLMQAVHTASTKLKDVQGRTMTSTENTDVQAIDDLVGVSQYVTKDIDHWLPERRSMAFEVTARGLDLGTQLNGAAP